MSTPNYGLPFPVMSDVPNVPAAVQALAEATDAALAVEARHVLASSSRSADSAPGQATTAISPQISITDAPAGLYLVTVQAKAANTDTAYHANYAQIVFAGITHEYWRFDNNSAYQFTAQLVLPVQWAGGTLTVVANWRATQPFVLYSGSRTQVARVSA